MFKLNKKTMNAIANNAKGVNRFKISAADLDGCFFMLPLGQLVDEEVMANKKLATLASRRVENTQVSSARLMSTTADLAEIEFCLGLFSIAYGEEEFFDVDEDTTAEEIYQQLLYKKEELSPTSRAKIIEAEEVISRAKAILGKAWGGFKTVNGAIVGVSGVVAHTLVKQGRKGLNGFGRWLAKATAPEK